MNVNFNTKYQEDLLYEYIEKLNIIIDMFDNYQTQVYILNESKPRLMPSQETPSNFVYEFNFCFDNTKHNFCNNYDNLITSKINNINYSYELLCAEYIQQIINSIYRFYEYNFSLNPRSNYKSNRHLYEIQEITFIVNDTFDFKILDMICKILHNRYVFKYIKRSDCIKNTLTYYNIINNDIKTTINDCVIYIDEHSTYIMKYTTNNTLFTQCNEIHNFEHGYNELIKDIQKVIPHIEVKAIMDLIKYIMEIDDEYDFSENIKNIYNDLIINGMDIDDYYSNYNITNIKNIIYDYFNEIIDYIRQTCSEDYNIYVFGKLYCLNQYCAEKLPNYRIKYSIPNSDIIIYCNAINNIYAILRYYIDYSFTKNREIPINLTNLITNEMITSYTTNNDKMFQLEIQSYDLYKYFTDNKYIPFINAIECDLSKNLLDMYTFDTIINTDKVMKPSMINMINGLINSRKIKDLIPKTDSNGDIITVYNIYYRNLYTYLGNVENTIDIDVLKEILYKHGQIQSAIDNDGNQIILYYPTDKNFKDDVMRFIQNNIINVNNFTEYCKRFINNTK